MVIFLGTLRYRGEFVRDVRFLRIFLLCAEILNIIIKNNNTIRGITINNTTFKMSQYADDSVIINDGSHETLQEIHIVLEHFATVSGLKVNYDKSYLFPVRGIFTSCT